MSKNYLTYPFKTMRITQSYNGSTSHYNHMTGKPCDYSLDEGGNDAGRDWILCPCDEMKIVKIAGYKNGKTNTVWLTSTSKVVTPCGVEDIVTMQCIHPNDDDLAKLKEGQKFKRGEKMFREGSDNATGNHMHMAIGFGTIKGTGYVLNSKNSWVNSTSGAQRKPEDMFFLDKSFTKVLDKKGLNFKELPKETAASTTSKTTQTTYKPGNYKVNTAVLYLRVGAGTEYAAKKFTELSADAQKKIKALNDGKSANGYVMGVEFTASEVKYNSKDKHYWGKTPSGWVALDYCKKI